MASLRAQMSFKSDRGRSGLYGGWGKTVHSSFVIVSLFSNLRVVVLCHVEEGFQGHIYEVELT